ncbi:MAG: D-alanyl-D-alanine carboxypeptidase/D-alanyl-D-alanine-endopeptidase [Acidimicrobiales bacterium]
MRKFLLLLFALLLLLTAVASPTMAASEDSPDSINTSSLVTPITPLLSARRFPGALQASSADPEIVASGRQYLSKVVGSTCAIVEQDGRVIVSSQPEDSLVPASLMKLATALGALDLLGADHVFTTRFLSDSSIRDGNLNGNLYIVGGGDPLLTTAGYKTVFDDPNQLSEDFNALAQTLTDAGVTSIAGNIVGDDSRYDSQRWLPSWPSRYQLGGTVSPLSALVVNDGSTGYVNSPNDATTERQAGDPPLLFAQTLSTVLRTRGIDIGGAAVVGRTPKDANEIAHFDSVPLSQVLSEMLLNSDNTTAELVVREVGLAANGQGTTSSGIDAIKQSLANQGFNTNGLVMIDGSGLDTGGRMSCSLALALVKAVAAVPELRDSLPLGGRSGTLRKRMLSTPSMGKVRAKTGTLNSVNALAGFVDTPQGNTLTFAFLHNGADTRTTGVADGFTDRLVPYGKSPKISSLGPLPIK